MRSVCLPPESAYGCHERSSISHDGAQAGSVRCDYPVASGGLYLGRKLIEPEHDARPAFSLGFKNQKGATEAN